ncbi:hypothetical protein A33_023966, partial [Vibrio cholerae AM-19226]
QWDWKRRALTVPLGRLLCALPKMPFDTIIRYFLVFMEMGSWLKTQVSLLVNTSMALLQAKYKVDVTAQQVKSFALRYVYSKTKKPNYSHSVNYLLKVSKVVMLIMTLIASSMNSIVKTFDETI